ncbi:winged helix-turn-helix transcriptional regulator [Streptomyces sp. NPDC006552]|uniref:winged helix-turn-helix transcriptional regulator n=1 Tax=Streptomyces sp. NPDC006552 TaxID=3157179 RepID=UPI0033AEE67B
MTGVVHEVEPGAPAALSEVHRVPVAALLPADSPRRRPHSPEHTELLATPDTSMPPIVVHRPSMRVVDGMYRLRAALLRGRSAIDVRFFEGPAEDAFVFAVEANIAHGLPLSLAERTAAAVRILGSHPQWSDRAIASVTGLAAKTVAAQRARLGGVTAAATTRLGRDGRIRPLSSAEGRITASRLLREHPDASLRDIARRAGISPGTVRDVRARLGRGEDIVPDRLRVGPKPPAPPAVAAPPRLPGPAAAPPDAVGAFRSLCRDPSLRLTDQGRQLLRMVEAHVLDPGRLERAARAVPAHQAAQVAALALECAQQWQRLASRVDRPALVPDA